MRSLSKVALAVALAVSLAAPATAAPADPAATKPRTKIKVYPAKKWRGYGFLPGYRQPPALTDWRAQNRISAMREMTEPRYFNWYGEPGYGWGRPGFYRGQWTGGSFGPCYASTPIGMMPTC